MRKALAFSFITLGITSIIAQVLLIRELLIVFYGNEFFIGWTLFAWLFWVGLGALLCGRLCAKTWNTARLVIGCHILAALFLPAAIALIRCSRTWLGTVPGAVPDILPAMAYALVVLAPLCLVLGAQFVLGSRAWKSGVADTGFGRILGRAYVYETVGFVAGGVLFGTLLVVMNEFRVAGLLGGLNVMAGIAIYVESRNRSLILRWILNAVIMVLFLVFFLGGRINRETSALRFPAQKLVESRNSIYGNIAVTAIGRQYNFYENGLLLGAAEEQMASEQLVHFPMLWHPNPKRVLLVGNGFNGALHEILKHQPERVDYVELDPLLIEMAQKYVSSTQQMALADPRVKTVFADGRFYLNQLAMTGSAAAYDVVIINLPDPSTALINRFYSLEFFRDIRRQLASGGVLAVRLAFAPDYLSRELDDFGTSIYRTLRANFAAVSILPEYEIFYLATDAGASPTPADLAERYQQRGLHTAFVVPPYIQYRMTTDRIGQVRRAFETNSTAQLNRDERPIACYYNFVYWLSSFHPRAAVLAGRAGAVRWPWAAAAAAVVLAGMALSIRGRKARRVGAWAMGIGSFTLMAGELAILLSFQVFCGYLYYKLALIIAALMLGMAIGTGLGTQALGRARPRTLAGIHMLVAAYAAGFASFTRFLGSAAIGQSMGIEWAFLLLAAAIGGLIGFEFPVANRIYLGDDAEDPRKTGIIYGIDLIGSCIGALWIGLWALPVLGVLATMILLAALNSAVALLCMRNGGGGYSLSPKTSAVKT